MNRLLYIAYLLILSITASTGSCIDNNSKNKTTKFENIMPLKEKIINIGKEVTDLTSPSSLFNSKFFIEVYENPNNYINDAIKILSDTSVAEQQKFIVIYSMQNLEVKEYKKFFKNCALLYKNDVLSEQQVRTVISSGFGKKHIIVKNYKDKEIKEALREIQDSENTSTEFNQYIENIIKGKAWKELKSFLRNSGM